ncbi:hypothetical protein MAR_004211 [Mya arenaria]|uniref:Uncharacterized protein n=1 Tax=Mya arenaria TaxID=6604 RepID=A0ABY7EZL9_MYAAR|nr:hypothetical protein MAR_004211 [Mya arenaria]
MCLNASTCTYEMTTSDVEQEYLCIAKNIHGSDNGSIIVPVRQRAGQLQMEMPSSKDMPSCEAKTKCVENAAMESLVQRQERSINNLVYADVHVEHLEKSRVGKRACNEEDRREYSAILFDKSCGVKPDSSNDN